MVTRSGHLVKKSRRGRITGLSTLPQDFMDTSPDADDLRRDQAHLIHSLHNRRDQEQARVWVSGYGAVLVDENGKEYLDALAGLWNVIAGHGRSELGHAAARQM